LANLLRNLAFKKSLSQTYWKRYQEYGATPKGSFWLTKSRQNQRFELILKAMPKLTQPHDITLADIGCGYGALAQYLATDQHFDHIAYSGYDISPDLIQECQTKYKNPRFHFALGTYPKVATNCVVMSGTYNLAATRQLTVWEDYVIECLQKCWEKTIHTMIFNLQVAPKAQIAHDCIYYAQARNILDLCQKRFGPTKITSHPNLAHDATFCVTRSH
jgi:SAM-dependent methyltransferase